MTNIDQLINSLTLDEKVSLLSGFNSWYTNKIGNKNIPSIKIYATFERYNNVAAFVRISLTKLPNNSTES